MAAAIYGSIEVLRVDRTNKRTAATYQPHGSVSRGSLRDSGCHQERMHQYYADIASVDRYRDERRCRQFCSISTSTQLVLFGSRVVEMVSGWRTAWTKMLFTVLWPMLHTVEGGCIMGENMVEVCVLCVLCVQIKHEKKFYTISI